jgi:hypothetical protein
VSKFPSVTAQSRNHTDRKAVAHKWSHKAVLGCQRPVQNSLDVQNMIHSCGNFVLVWTSSHRCGKWRRKRACGILSGDAIRSWNMNGNPLFWKQCATSRCVLADDK